MLLLSENVYLHQEKHDIHQWQKWKMQATFKIICLPLCEYIKLSLKFHPAWTPHPNISTLPLMRECAQASLWYTCSRATVKLKLTIWKATLKISAGREKGTVFNDGAWVSIISPPPSCLSHSYTPSSHPHLSRLLSSSLVSSSSNSPPRECPL